MRYGTRMATTYPMSTLLTVEDFLEIDFGDKKAELDNGVIRMMAGGTGSHARVQGNIISFLRTALRGSGCRPYGSDMGVRAHDLSLRYPDVSVFCGRDTPDNDALKTFDDPRMIVEILSPSTASDDLRIKLPEYRTIASIETILFVDPDTGTMRLLQRTGAASWTDAELPVGSDVPLPTFGLTMPNSEIFSRD